MAKITKVVREMNTVAANGDELINKFGTSEELVLVDGGTKTLATKLSEISSSKITDVAYDELVVLKDESKLVPGSLYRITDYRTIYKQASSYLVMGREGDDCVSIPEPLIVIATSTDTLDCKAYSPMHPKDEIWYDINNDEDKYYQVATPEGKGVIYRRIDANNNDVPYDHKNIRFRRWKVDYESYPIWNTTSTYTKGTIVRNSGAANYVLYIAVKAVPANQVLPSSGSGNDYWFMLLTALNNDYLGVPEPFYPDKCKICNDIQIKLASQTKDYYTFDSGMCRDASLDTTVYNNKFCTDTYSYNSVFLGSHDMLTITNNVINNIFYNNTLTGFSSNIIMGNFNNNIGIFDSNTIRGEFSYNVIGFGFKCNDIGSLFSSNHIVNYFEYNNIGNRFKSNSIGYSFEHNSVEGYFESNLVSNRFRLNTVKSGVVNSNLLDATELYNKTYNHTLETRQGNKVIYWWFNESNQIEIAEVS